MFYNEIDPYAAQWLRNLVAAGHLPAGHVDERSILDLEPADLAGYRQCHFFAGIGGWPYALDLAGWPDDREVWTGSCPCQPFSSAGKRGGKSDERHLWPAWLRLIRECRPSIIFGEQVASADVVGIAQEMQKVRRRKGIERLQAAQQGRRSWDLPGLREQERTRDEALAIRAQAGLSAGKAPDPSRLCVDERRETASAGEEYSFRIGLAGNSGTDRYRDLRGNGTSFQSGRAEGLECSIAGSAGTGEGLYAGEREGRPLRAQYNGEQLGDRENLDDSGRGKGETVRECVERLIAENLRTPEGELTWLDGIRSDLADAGYTVGACIVPACAVNAPHIRQRLFWMADASDGGRLGSREDHAKHVASRPLERSNPQHDRHTSQGCAVEGSDGGLGDADEPRSQGRSEYAGEYADQRPAGTTGHWSSAVWLPCLDGRARRVEPSIFPLATGLPAAMDGVSPISRVGTLRGAGNSIVPQVAAAFIKAFWKITLSARSAASCTPRAVPRD